MARPNDHQFLVLEQTDERTDERQLIWPLASTPKIKTYSSSVSCLTLVMCNKNYSGNQDYTLLGNYRLFLKFVSLFVAETLLET